MATPWILFSGFINSFRYKVLPGHFYVHRGGKAVSKKSMSVISDSRCVCVNIFTSLAKEVMFLVALVSLSVLSVCLSVCLFVCGQHYSKSYERIGMKFYGRILSSTRKN